MSSIILFLYKIALALKRWHIPIVPSLIKFFIRFVFGCYLGVGAQIGKDTQLAYGGLGTVIHDHAVIGRNVYIGTNVTIGGRNGALTVPVIGDSCFIGTGAKILGAIHVGGIP